MNTVVGAQYTNLGKRQIIVETAFSLFKQNGFYATGIDAIMRSASVSKRTLYKYFPSKNDLIVAVLHHYQSRYQAHMDKIVDPEKSGRDNIKAIFEDACQWFTNVNFHGCLAINAMGEFADKDSAIEAACREFKAWEMETLVRQSQYIDHKNPEQLAYKLFVLLEGMAAIAQVSKGICPVDMVAMAENVIVMHLEEQSS